MTLPEKQPGTDSEPLAVPLDRLVEWYHDNRDVLNNERARVTAQIENRTLPRTPETERNIERDVGAALGKREVLTDFRGFLTAYTLEVGGKLDDVNSLLD